MHPVPNPYLKKIKTNADGEVDVYAVILAFKVTCPGLQHAIKKILTPGLRGAEKDRTTDLEEAINSIRRSIELHP